MRLPRVCTGLLVLACTAAAGCGDDDGGAATASGGGGRTYKVGVVGFAAAEPTSQQAVRGLEAGARKQGHEVTSIDAQASPDKAVAAMQSLVQKRVDLIVTVVFPSKSLAAGALAAKAAAIPVVSMAGGLADGVQVDYDAGVEHGRRIAAKLMQDTGGRGKLLVLGRKSGLPCFLREQALDEAIRGADFDVTRNEVPIPGQVEGGTKFAEAWLAKNRGGGDLAVWACFDDPALGAVSAFRQAGRKDVKVYGVNGTPAALKAIRRGDMAATIYLDAYGAGQRMAAHIAEYVEAGVNAKPVTESIPASLIDRSTIDEFLREHPRAMEGL
jgi:ribose transport system substrate-binding protein